MHSVLTSVCHPNRKLYLLIGYYYQEKFCPFQDIVPPTRQNDKFSNAAYPYVRGSGNNIGHEDDYRAYPHRCSERLEDALDQIRRRQVAKQKTLHLSGYSLHQQLRSAPYDMYVSDMRVRLPSSSSWVRVDQCRYNPRNSSLETRLLFNDLTISGRVNLFDEEQLQRTPVDFHQQDSCSMILRLRRAGIGQVLLFIYLS